MAPKTGSTHRGKTPAEQELSTELLNGGDALSTPRDECNTTGQISADWDGICTDAALIKRCIAGEVAAWEDLYGQCHTPLLRFIECMLGTLDCDPNLVDELAARVWYALVADDGELLAQFDARRGARLSTFMQGVARDLAGRYFRAERRRRSRERAASRVRRGYATRRSNEAELSLSEFRETLSPGEREFLDRHCRGDPEMDVDGARKKPLSVYSRKLVARIRRKW